MRKITLAFFACLFSLCGYAQLANEGFEGTFPPPGWGVYDNTIGTNFTWQKSAAPLPAHTGDYAAYINKENVATGIPQDWLITPQLTLPADAQLRFWSRLTQGGNQGTIYQIRISTVPIVQGNLNNYFLLQSYTETELNPAQDVYTEKVLTIPAAIALPGAQVYIAFVMLGDNGDRWLVDDVRLLPRCADPSAGTASNIGLTTASLNWNNPGGATAWEIEIVNAAAAPTGTGVVYTGPLPYPATLLTADTDYKFFVRSLCNNGTGLQNNSTWVGPFAFSTIAVGATCAAPIVIPTVNYSTTDNTGNYGDDFEGAPGSTGCGTTSATYLNGDEVVYAYTSAFTGFLSVNMSGTGPNAGMFIYNSCANIGVSCVAGGIGNASTPVNIASLAVTAGTTYYIVISTSGTTQSTPYTLVVQQVNCPAPTGLTSAGINASSADLTWNTGAAISWEVAIQAAGSGLPQTPGITTTVNAGFDATQTTSGNPLQPATPYEYYVRADCGNGTFSAWTGPHLFTTTQIPAVLNYTQDWESATSGWTLNNGSQANKWVVGPAINNGGTKALYISNDAGTTNAYTITGATSTVQAYRDIQMPAVAGQVSISFDWKSQGESNIDYFRVWVVPATFLPVPGVAIGTGTNRIQVGGNYQLNNTFTRVNGVVNAAAYSGQVMRVVFEWKNDANNGVQPPAAIDNIEISAVTCQAPTALTMGAVTETQATVNWNSPLLAPQGYDYYYSTTNTPPTAATVPYGNVTATTATVTGLQPSTAYTVWVRSNCGADDGNSFWTGPISFNTPQIPAQLNFIQDFETPLAGWTFNNENQVNKWTAGTAVSNGGTGSLYISSDGGATNNYNMQGAISTVQAYRDIQMPAALDQLSLSFDWKSVGENNFDYLRVWMVPITFTPVAGTQITAGAGRVQIGGNFQLNNTFTNYTAVLNSAAYGGQIRRLVFEWKNDGGGGLNPPAAVDNISLSVVTCPAPTALTLVNFDGVTANLSWTAPSSVTPTYDYYLSTTITPPVASTPATANVPGTTAAITSLQPSANYFVWIRANCGAADGASFWIGPVTFSTPQVPATMNLLQDFESPSSGFTLSNGTQPNKWVIGNAVNNGGAQSLYISNNNGVGNTYSNNVTTAVHAYRDVLIPSPVVDVSLRFDWRAAGESTFDYIRVWLVPVTFNPVPGTNITAAADRIQLSGILNQSASFTTADFTFNASAYAGTAKRIVFEWRNDNSGGDQPPGAVDNINFSVITCPKPTALSVASVTDSQALLDWAEPGAANNWEVYVAPAGSLPPSANTVGMLAAGHPFTTTQPLEQNTNYVFYVRSLCGTNDISFWAGPFSFKTPIGNDACADARILPVNPTDACVAVTAVSFVGSTASPEATNCANTIIGTDVWYQFTATNDAHGIKLSDFTGTTDPVVISLYEGEDCATLIQLSCSQVNVLNANFLVTGNTYKVRVHINRANPDKTTAFNICINTPPPPINGNQSACVVNTINPSFEEPAPVTFVYPPIISQNIVPGWRTTAADQMIEFWPSPNYENVPSYDGIQFIELNANLVSGIYQDFATPQSTEFSYSFAHRGRQGTDTVQLLAGPPGGPYDPVGPPVVTGNTAWSFNTGSYVSPATQTTTRFIFQSVSSVGGASIGNFLDAITFTANNGILSQNPTTVDCVNSVASISAAGSGTWIAHGDNPGVTAFANANNNTTTVSGFTASGTYRYDWNTSYCISTLEIMYDNGNVPSPAAVTEVNYCLNEIVPPVSATPLADHILNWYTAATGGTAGENAPTPDTSVTGISTYYVSQTSAANCESARIAISVTVNEVPAAPAVADLIYCQNDASGAVPLTAQVLPGNTLIWYAEANGGSALPAAPVPVINTPAVTTYYVSQASSSLCESPRAAIKVTINSSVVPVTDFTITPSICISGANQLPVPGPGFTAGGNYTSSAGLVIDPATGEINVNGSIAGQYTVRYAINADPAVCNTGSFSEQQITITPLAPANTSFGYTSPVCLNTANQLPVKANGFTEGGTFTADAGLIINAATGEADIAGSAQGTYNITYTVAENAANCTAAGSSTQSITITPAIIPVTVFNYDDSYCAGTTSASPDKSAGFSNGGQFTFSPAGLSINAATGAVDVAASTPGTYTVTYTVAQDLASCNAGGTTSDTFTIIGAVSFSLTGDCEAGVYIATATPLNGSFNPDSVSYEWTTAQGAPVGYNSNTFNVTAYAGSNPGNETFPLEFILTVTSDGCETSGNIIVEDIACSIQKGISPNGDGLNDSFNLTAMGVKRLSIFNRYGKEVYTYTNYTNQWHGQGSNGDKVPTGTYYYMIERNTGENKTGWVYVNREE